MYCFEAHKCTKYDCPVMKNRARRCWQYFENALQKTPPKSVCPYGPCETCNYKLGWEIGLISDELFTAMPSYNTRDIMPKPASIAKQPESPKKQESSAKAFWVKEADKKNVPPGKKEGLRFCYELIECNNPNCIIKQRQIFACFKFFASRDNETKIKMTKCSRNCAECYYKHGWDIGLLNEGMFDDIISKKKLKMANAARIKRNTLVDIYLAELAKKPLTRHEEIALAKRIAGDREASELFLTANLKLVMKIAQRYKGGSLGIMDLIQEGNIGLIKAISKFDYTLGYRFSTYAAYWVRYYMQKALARQGSVISIPCHMLTVAHKLRRKIQEFEAEFFRSPSIDEITEITGMQPNKVLNILTLTQTPVSIYAKAADEDEEGEIEYFLEDKNQLTPEEQALENLKAEALNAGINNLPERLRYVVRNYYGFEKEELSLAEIGRRLEISRERVRQLLQNALQRLEKEKLIAELK